MRKILIGITAILVIAVAAVLIGPSFVDWNKYKGEIESQVEALTGRKLVIAGDISIAILPAPAVIAKDVSFSNDPRSANPNMVELGSLEVRVALGPLFGGDIQVSKIVIVEPIIQLETFEDGTNNWTLDIASDGNGDVADSGEQGAAEPTDSGNGMLAGITLDNFAIERGLLTFLDGASGALHVVEDINASLVAASLQGPFEARGDLVAKGIPLGFEIGIDGIFQGRTVPITAVFNSLGDTSLAVAGNIINLFDAPRFNGSVQVTSASLPEFAALIGADLPMALAQPFSINGSIIADQQAVAISDLKLSFGELTANGAVEVALDEVPRANVRLDIGHVDVDAILNALTQAATASEQFASAQQGEAAEPGDGKPDVSGSESKSPGKIAIPNGFGAALNLTVESIAYRGEKAGPVRLSAELSNGEVTLSQLTGQLPGATDFAVFGFLTAQGGDPSFEGEVEASVGDTRGLARWLGVDLSAVPGDRFRRIEASASLKGNAENLQAAGIRVAFDRTTLKGGVTLALRDRLSFGAALDVDTIDLDPYLVGLGTVPQSGGTGGDGDAAAVQSDGKADTAAGVPEANPLGALDVLAGFDANIRAKAGEVIYSGQPIRNINVDATIFNGAVTLRDLSVADLVGARVALKGGIEDVAGVPKLDGMNIDFQAKSVAGLAKLAAVDLPVPASALGSVSLKASVDGNILAPSIKGQAAAAGVNATFDGDVSVLPVKPLYAGSLRFSHPDMAALLNALEIGYTPSGPIGGVDLSMNASIAPATMTLQGIAGQINQTSVSGDTTVQLAGVRPNIRSNIALGSFDAGPFLPAKSGGEARGSGSGDTDASAANDNQPGYAGGTAPWSKEPIDLSGLEALDATVDLTAKQLAYGLIALNDATIRARLANSQLTIEQLTGTAFGGALDVTGFLDGQTVPAANAAISFSNANISKLLMAVIGQPAAVGTVALETSFDTNGRSVADMVSALNGKGGFAMRGVDVSGSTQGSAMTGILGLVRSFGQLGSSLSGKKLEGLADVDGQFTIASGVADLSPLTIDAGLGSGAAAGKVDLPGWAVDLDGSIDITGNILTALLGAKVGAPGKLPFSVEGPLDAPNISLDTSGLAGSGLPIPGLDKLDEKLPGVGGLLQGILGGGSTQQTQPQEQVPAGDGSQPAPQPQPQQQEQTIQPQDLLKNIFKF